MLDRIGPEVVGFLAEDASREGIPPALPKTYVSLLRDQALTPATRTGRSPTCAPLPVARRGRRDDSGHDVMISRPQALAEVLSSFTG